MGDSPHSADRRVFAVHLHGSSKSDTGMMMDIFLARPLF